MIACSSSARKPIDSTRTVPGPMERSSGTIFPALASTSPSMPSRRGTEKPQMSASRIPTTRPREARATARLTVTEDLPTPPLPEAMAKDPGGGGDRRLGCVLASLPAGPRHDGGPLVRVHGRHLHVDRAHPVERSHVVDHVPLDLAAQRAGGDGQGHVDDDVATLDGDRPDHAEIDDGVAQLGVHHRPQAVTDLLLADLPRGLPRRGRR